MFSNLTHVVTSRTNAVANGVPRSTTLNSRAKPARPLVDRPEAPSAKTATTSYSSAAANSRSRNSCMRRDSACNLSLVDRLR